MKFWNLPFFPTQKSKHQRFPEASKLETPNSKLSSVRRGQSVIEAMIAIGVITTGFLGIMGLLSRSFFYNREIGDKTRATYLAAEGVEIAKNLIDHDVYEKLAGVGGAGGWGSCFAAVAPSGHADLQMDYLTTNCGALVDYSANVPLQFDPATKRYSYAATAGSYASPFTRDVRVVINGDEITVTSIVDWSTGPLTGQSVDLVDEFYNWRP